MTVEASASAKIILLGEHAVVYGQPAIAVPVSSLRVTVSATSQGKGIHIVTPDLNHALPADFQAQPVNDALALTTDLVLEKLQSPPPDLTITIRSQIPLASGLGSGAAVSTALARVLCTALDRSLDDASLNEIIYEVEKIHHGTPSGIDNTVIVYEKPVYFVRNQPIETIEIGQPFTLLIGDTGQAASTRIAVGDVRKLYEANPLQTQPILDAVGQIVVEARNCIKTGDITTLGQLMTRNHGYLQQLTVSSAHLDQLVDAALAAGALGAKLSGGGRGGNMIALVTETSKTNVHGALLKVGAVRVFETTVIG